MADNQRERSTHWSNPSGGAFVHPDSPAGGSGPGSSRVPGAHNYAPLGKAIPHTDSPAGRHYAWHSELPRIDAQERAGAVLAAIAGARHHVRQALLDATGYELHEIVAGIIPGLLVFLGILGISTAVGAAAGAAVGALAFGIGAAPGSVVGAEIGFEAGIALLDFLGLAFLAVYIGKALLQAAIVAADAMKMAWRSVDHPNTKKGAIEHAAERLAYAVGLVFRGLLQGIVAFLLAKGIAAAASRVPELVGKLRSSKLGAGFAAWIERNWEGLIKNPRLKPEMGSGSGGSGAAGDMVAAQRAEMRPEASPPRQRLGPREEAPPKEITDPIAQRRAANQALRNSPQFEKDLAKANVSQEQLQWMNNKEAPLGFESPQQFQSFKQELSQALRQDGLHDAQVGMKGTATTFYSENPGKPVGHFWDADPTHPGDYDLNLSSNKMAQQMDNAGIDASPKYGVFRTADMNTQFPAVSDFSAKWSGILGRDVNVVGYPADTVPVRDPTEFILVK